MLISGKHTFKIDSDGKPTNPLEHTIDLTYEMSNKLGALVRQGQTVKLHSLHVSMTGLDGFLTDQEDQSGGGAVSGDFKWLIPTQSRAAAWRQSFSHVQSLRRNSGAEPVDNYDFRVGLDTQWDTVAMNAWAHRDDDPLFLTDLTSLSGEGTGSHTQSIFDSYNSRRNQQDPINLTVEDTLGSPYAFFDASSQTDPDFMINDPTSTSWKLGDATSAYETMRYVASFSGKFDDPGNHQYTNDAYEWSSDFMTPQKVMCGLLQFSIDATTIDDTLDNEDITVYWTAEVSSGGSLASRGRKRGRRSRK